MGPKVASILYIVSITFYVKKNNLVLEFNYGTIYDFIMTDKQIIKKIVKWLKLNIKAFNNGGLNTDLLTDNKNLLKAIEDWK